MKLLVLVLAALLGGGAQAAPRPPKGKKPAVEAPKKALPAPPTSDAAQGPLSELSETLGGLARLSELCAPDLKPNPWRARMEGFIDAEGEASGARERMNGAFNRGYADFSTSHQRCTPAARAAEDDLRREAGRLARLINQRFGG